MWLVLILKDFKLIITWIKTIKNSHRKINFYPVVPRVTVGRYKNKKFQLTYAINHWNQWITVPMSSYSLKGPLIIPYHEITKVSVLFIDSSNKMDLYIPTLLDYPGVSQIWHWSPTLPSGSPNLPDKMDFWDYLCFSLKFCPIFSQNS